MGIEPTSSAWKAEVLPLNYTRNLAKKLLITCIRQNPDHPTSPPDIMNQSPGERSSSTLNDRKNELRHST